MNDHMPQSDAGTLTEKAVEQLQRDILSGELQPGVKLGIAGLVDAYGIGATPIREALTRLMAQNLITANDRRGFSVRELSHEDLLDITNTRFLIEREGLRLSMQLGGDEWEAHVIAQLHRLRLFVERNASNFREFHDELDPLHRNFHASLIAGCQSPRIIELAENLYNQAFRYRRILMRTWADPESYVKNHAELLDTVLARNEPKATELLYEHLRSTLRKVYPDLPDS